MATVAELVKSLGGMAQKRQLARRGARDHHLTAAVQRGEVIRARQGWYTTLPPTDERVRAVRVGGRLTGISALIAMGCWVLGKHPLHVSVNRNSARLRSPGNRFQPIERAEVHNVVLHWDGWETRERGSTMAVSLVDALVRVVRDEPLEVAVAALDWACHTGQIDRIDFERVLLMLPRNKRAIAHWVDEGCESLPESLARTRLRLSGHKVVSQVLLGDFQRIDLVVDGCVAIEVDGEEFHREHFARDRSKDLDITNRKLHAIRPTASAVFREWSRVAMAIESAIAARASGFVAVDIVAGPPPPRPSPGKPRRRPHHPSSSREYGR